MVNDLVNHVVNGVVNDRTLFDVWCRHEVTLLQCQELARSRLQNTLSAELQMLNLSVLSGMLLPPTLQE